MKSEYQGKIYHKTSEAATQVDPERSIFQNGGHYMFQLIRQLSESYGSKDGWMRIHEAGIILLSCYLQHYPSTFRVAVVGFISLDSVVS